MIKKIVVFAIAMLVTMSITTQTTSHANDIKGHPLAEGLTYWADLNVIRPDAKGNYNPNRAVTRGEFASYLSRAFDLPASNSMTFKDLKADEERTNEIQAAAGASILSGYPDGTFRPNDKITREQMAALLQRALVYSKIPLNGAPLTFKDNDKIRSEFKSAVATNVYYNIIAGSLTAKGIYFEPKSSATIAQAAAFLYRMDTTIDKYNAEQNNETPVTPPVSNPSNYYIGKISNGVVTKNPTIYYNYEQAAAAQKAASLNLIFKGDKIIQMPAGLASAADTTANTTTIYADSSFKTALTYAAEGNEFKYYSSNDKYAIVRLADTKGYAKIDEVTLTPSSLLKGENYYYVAGGYLTHKLYNHITEKYIGEYVVSAAPAFMKPGVNYYSQDGVNFYSDFLLTNKVGTNYSYFQFASVRQPSNYTAEELDHIITTMLEERQQLGGNYKNAPIDSRLIGMGTLLKQVEASHHVNALFILAAAMHESDYGISTNSMQKNNIFGIKVYDANTALGTSFASRDDSVMAFLNQYVNLNYVPQSGGYAKGAAPGNKTSGLNVHYASDPFWGSKIAGHMYRLDNRFGKKDYNQANLAFVVNNGDLVNTRAEATTNSEKVFTYKAKNVGETNSFGYPVVITEETTGSDGYVWYKLLSDANPPSEYVWVRSDLVQKFTAN
ncbi:benzene 1,2-dioxygenase [Lysinibacillus sp. 2017]|uniref:S-layer homology domain-containing protein n=1 Tax=unclassified Lysinibacillus TaxID=2636778 RepID=UPI000D525CA9|nr:MULTISPECIES: S-layer homology domain-containing protein [unclassified Lysinibacillus]AWE06364.1 benzene 1,2-dioxygenase [Lysinibacillus sp. 2017]TGN31566.1 benzene 1,2-dioxygenase [Lysinibacillus sp. S2017]